MKKIVLIMLSIITILKTIPVEAANYEMKELIPVDIKTTIVTTRYSYKNFYYNTGTKEDSDKTTANSIVFSGIKNLSDEARTINFSIALFDENRLNIGTINYCDGNLNSKEETQFVIPITEEYLGKDVKAKDIKYISMLSDNITCRKEGSRDYIGQTIKEIGIKKNNVITTPIKVTLITFGVVGGIILVLFLYSFMFTQDHMNVDGEDVRRSFVYTNNQLREKREMDKILHPEAPKEVKQIKTDEVLRQEEAAKHEDKSGTDLHNLYK